MVVYKLIQHMLVCIPPCFDIDTECFPSHKPIQILLVLFCALTVESNIIMIISMPLYILLQRVKSFSLEDALLTDLYEPFL